MGEMRNAYKMLGQKERKKERNMEGQTKIMGKENVEERIFVARRTVSQTNSESRPIDR
jgi:hypothetical protein